MVKENFLMVWYRKCTKIRPSDVLQVTHTLKTCILLDARQYYHDLLCHRK